MKTLIICFSYHHKNTEKIASVLANVLEAQIKTPLEVDLQELSDYDLVGFGSGISFGHHYKALLDLAEKMPAVPTKKPSYSLQAVKGKTDLSSTESYEKNSNPRDLALLVNSTVLDLILMDF